MIAIMSDFPASLQSLSGGKRSIPAGRALFDIGDEIAFLYVVESGCIQLVRHDGEGAAAIMQRALPGAILAESSIFSDRYHCAAEAVADSTVSLCPIAQVREKLTSDAGFAAALAKYLAREVQSVRTRAELLGRRTVRQRLDGWLAANGGKLPEKGRWRLVAQDIGVTPEAFYRELQRRKRGH